MTHLKGKRKRSGGDCRDERSCRVQELNKRRYVRDTVADEDGKKTGKDVGQGQRGGRKETGRLELGTDNLRHRGEECIQVGIC